MNDKQQAAAEIVEMLNKGLAKIINQIDRYKGVMLGTPYVIEVCPSMYLVADGTGYRGGSVTGRTVMYGPDRIDDVVAYLRKSSPDVWGMARAVHIKDALREEAQKTADMIRKFEALAA